jgi:hypothetical protein
MKKKTDFIAKANLPDGINYEAINLDELIAGVHKEVFKQCINIILEKYETGVYNKAKLNYMHSRINKCYINVEYQTIKNLVWACNSFFSNSKSQRWCLACLNQSLHILKGHEAFEFDS